MLIKQTFFLTLGLVAVGVMHISALNSPMSMWTERQILEEIVKEIRETNKILREIKGHIKW